MTIHASDLLHARQPWGLTIQKIAEDTLAHRAEATINAMTAMAECMTIDHVRARLPVYTPRMNLVSTKEPQ